MKTASFFLVGIVSVLLATSEARSQSIILNETFIGDTTVFPFNGNATIYGITMSGSFHLNSDSSLVRVLVTGNNGELFMIYESYSLITDTFDVNFFRVCDETKYLNALTPQSLQIQIIDAMIHIDSLNLVLNHPGGNIEELQVSAKRACDSLKILIMNRRIQEEKMYWRAGRTNMSSKFYFEKKKVFGTKFRVDGIDYYKGGIFEFINLRDHTPSTSNIINRFDWRKRHGANNPESPYYDGDLYNTGWLTSVQDQEDCGSCYIFGPVGAAEARVNLYFNHNSFIQDVDLSEQEILSCQPQCSCAGGFAEYALNYLRDIGVKDEDCFMY